MIKQLTITALIVLVAGIILWSFAWHEGYCADEAEQAHVADAYHTTFVVDVSCMKKN